jgi:glutathione S-transferase
VAYKLYYAPGSAAMGVRVILEEIGAPYALIQTTIDMDKPRPPEQLALNPNGWVPVLIWGDNAMYECAAITIFLCDRHPEAQLAPGVDEAERGRFLQTLVYFSNSVQNAFQLNYYPDRFADTPGDEPSAKRRGIRRLRETWKVIDDQIGDSKWILGDRFSAADIYLFMLTTWLAPSRGHPSTDEFPNVKRIAEAVARRPSVQIVYAQWIAECKMSRS